ncbi:MAG: cytochrome c [Arenibacterium sp.]
MKTRTSLVAGLAIAACAATAVFSGGHADKAAMAAVKARKATMTLYAFELGALGGMAKGDIEYDADAAKAAASNLAKISSMNQMRLWMPGTSTAELGDATGALPAIWESGSKAADIGKELAMAAAAMESAAGEGLDSLRGAIGAVGKTCGACHDDYRKPQ